MLHSTMIEFVTCCVLPTIFLFLTILGIIWVSKNNKKTNENEILSWLQSRKAEGFITTDQLISYLQNTQTAQQQVTIQKTNKQIVFNQAEQVTNPNQLIFNSGQEQAASTQQNTIPNTQLDTQIGQTQSVPVFETNQKRSNGLFLLYLGAFLVMFSLFVLIAFNWDNFSSLVKSIILVITTILLFGVGFVCNTIKTLKPAAPAFITLGIIAFVCTGLGLWNFELSAILPISFSLYWLLYSALTIGISTACLKFFDMPKLSYVILTAVYSCFVSFAFTVTNDGNLRVAIIAVLNLIFYLNEQFLPQSKLISLTTRIINVLVDIAIMLKIISLAMDGTVQHPWIAISILSIPTIFQILAYLLKNAKVDAAIVLLLLPIKVYIGLIVLPAEMITFNIVMVTYAVIMLLYTCIQYWYLQQRSRTLSIISLVMQGFLTFIATMMLIASWVAFESITLSNWVVIFVLVTSAITIQLHPLLAKKYEYLSIVAMYNLFALARIISLIKPDIQPLQLIWVYLGVFAVLLGMVHIYKQTNHPIKQLVVTPVTAIASLIPLALSTSYFSSTNVLTAFLVVSILVTTFSYLNKYHLLRYATVILNIVWFGSLCILLSEKDIAFFDNINNVGLLFMIPAFIHLGEYEFHRRSKFVEFPAVLAILLFSFIALLGTVSSIGYLFITLCLYLIITLYYAVMYKNPVLYYFVMALLSGITWTGFGYLDVSFITIIFVTAALNASAMLLSSPYMFTQTVSDDIARLRFHVQTASIISITCIALLSILLTFVEPDYYVAGTAVLAGLAYILHQKANLLIRSLAGTSIILALWNILFIHDASLQFFVVPVTLYFFVISYFYKRSGQLTAAIVLECIGLTVQFSTLLLQSVSESGSAKIYYGIVLIIVSALSAVYGTLSKKQALLIISIVYLVIELLIRLYSYLLAIPWWIYLGVVGIALMVFAVRLIQKSASK